MRYFVFLFAISWVNILCACSQPAPPSQTSDEEVIERFHQIFYKGPNTWHKSKWLGIETLQNPNDVWITQEIIVEVAPDFSQVAKYADWWIPINAGQDLAFWMATNHVILTEYYVKKETPSFSAYIKQYTDSPLLVKLAKSDDGYEAGRSIELIQNHSQMRLAGAHLLHQVIQGLVAVIIKILTLSMEKFAFQLPMFQILKSFSINISI